MASPVFGENHNSLNPNSIEDQVSEISPALRINHPNNRIENLRQAAPGNGTVSEPPRNDPPRDGPLV